MMRQMPVNQRDIIRDLWSILIGTNGEGLVESFKAFVQEQRDYNGKLADRVAHIEAALPTFETHDEYAQRHKEFIAEQACAEEAVEEGKERRKMSRRDLVMLIIVGAGVVVPFILDKVFK